MSSTVQMITTPFSAKTQYCSQPSTAESLHRSNLNIYDSILCTPTSYFNSKKFRDERIDVFQNAIRFNIIISKFNLNPKTHSFKI